MPILTDQERIGTTIDKYRIESIIGRGGMGTVFAAVHTWTGRRAALKFLHPEYAQSEEATRRFHREAQAAAALRHPNVVDVLDMGSEQGSVYLALELLEGRSLADHIADKGRLELDETLDYLAPVMDALSRAHSMNIVHRDLKPENIFLSLDGKGRVVPKLLDFGIAKLTDGQGSMATSVGALIGTPAYMSPEQVAGTEHVGVATDIWAMGIVIYECLSGAVPFSATSPSALLIKIMTEEVPRLETRVPTVRGPICEALAMALMKDANKRFRSMEAFAKALGRIQHVSAAKGVAPVVITQRPPGSASGIQRPMVTHSDAAAVQRTPAQDASRAAFASTVDSSRPAAPAHVTQGNTGAQSAPLTGDSAGVMHLGRRAAIALAVAAALVVALATTLWLGREAGTQDSGELGADRGSSSAPIAADPIVAAAAAPERPAPIAVEPAQSRPPDQPQHAPPPEPKPVSALTVGPKPEPKGKTAKPAARVSARAPLPAPTANAPQQPTGEPDASAQVAAPATAPAMSPTKSPSSATGAPDLRQEF